MPEAGPRRSARLETYDSNGRDYLADIVGWSRQELEAWLTSKTVNPHLQLWYQLCISGERRFNEAVDWINTGENGYFYNAGDLEEDLLLACLGEGSGGDPDQGAAYAADDVKTGMWTTHEIWARTAWRIVQADSKIRKATGNAIGQHPSACYAFVIDVLCLAFHSVAFRGESSCYYELINSPTNPGAVSMKRLANHPAVVNDEVSESGLTITILSSAGSETAEDDLDSDYASSRTSIDSREWVRTKQAKPEGEGAIATAGKVEEWMKNMRNPELAGLKTDPLGLCLVYERGEAISGYRRAPSGYVISDVDAA